MSATRDGRGTKDVPKELREAVARAVEAEIAAKHKGKSERVIAKALGVSQPALNKIRHRTGALGLNALLDLRRSLRVSIDDLLGLPPLEDIDERIRRVLREERDRLTTPPERPESHAPPGPRTARPRRGVHE